MRKNRWKPGEVAIEFHTPDQNKDALWKPVAQRTCRSRWSARNIPEQASNAHYHTLPDVPGMIVALHAKERTLRFLDPLGFRENVHLLEKHNEMREQWEGQRYKAEDTAIHKGLTVSDVKTCMWHIFQWVEAGKATVLSGALPGQKEILDAPGELQLRWGETGRDEELFATKEEMERLRAVDSVTHETVAPEAVPA
jgi:hypothetical protein